MADTRRLDRRILGELTDGRLFAWVMLAPALVLLAVVLGMPLLSGVWLSFQHWVLTRPADQEAFVGLDNYARMIGDPDFWDAIWRSFFYTAGVVLGSLALGMGAAILTKAAFRGRWLARTMFVLPWAIPGVAAALVWGVMYDPNFGILNRLLSVVTFGSVTPEWLLDRNLVLPSLMLVQVWNEFPIAYIFLLAGLMAIPQELYEAADVDGASPRARFRFVTLPMMRFVIAVTTLLIAIFGFRSFAVIYVLTGGGPARNSETLIMQTYNEAFRRYDFSYSSTLGVASIVVTLVLTAVYLRLTFRRDLAAVPA
jgi:multiple sugar transport system permease protein